MVLKIPVHLNEKHVVVLWLSCVVIWIHLRVQRALKIELKLTLTYLEVSLNLGTTKQQNFLFVETHLNTQVVKTSSEEIHLFYTIFFGREYSFSLQKQKGISQRDFSNLSFIASVQYGYFMTKIMVSTIILLKLMKEYFL